MRYYSFKHQYHLKEVDSTSFELKRHVNEITNLTFLSADKQTSGKGRNGHTWESDDNNLLFSFVIKDKTLLKRFNELSLALGAIIFNILKSYDINNVSIKWPNDIYVNDKKIAGILMEGDISSYIVVGIGINVNQKEFNVPNATSIFNELNNKINVKTFKKRVFAAIIENLKNDSNLSNLISIAIKNNYLLNKKVSYQIGKNTYEGYVKNISKDGSLILNSNEKEISINCGEVFLINNLV